MSLGHIAGAAMSVVGAMVMVSAVVPEVRQFSTQAPRSLTTWFSAPLGLRDPGVVGPGSRDTSEELQRLIGKLNGNRNAVSPLGQDWATRANPPAPSPLHKLPAGPAPVVPKLFPGRILFQPERTMQLRHAEVVMVRMDAGSSPDLESGIDPKQYKVDTVKVAQRMRVHLAGNPPDAFDVVPMSPPDEQQAVTNISAATWMWDVTPKKDGEASLLLNIWALAKVEDSDTLVPLFQKTETIRVHGLALPEASATTFWDKALEKIAEHAGEGIWGLCGAALTALGGWIARWWKKPKKAAQAAG